MKRRQFIKNAAGLLIAAPMVVKADIIMPIKKINTRNYDKFETYGPSVNSFQGYFEDMIMRRHERINMSYPDGVSFGGNGRMIEIMFYD